MERCVYVADSKTGEAIYFLEEHEGRVIRGYPSGRTETADEQDVAFFYSEGKGEKA